MLCHLNSCPCLLNETKCRNSAIVLSFNFAFNDTQHAHAPWFFNGRWRCTNLLLTYLFIFFIHFTKKVREAPYDFETLLRIKSHQYLDNYKSIRSLFICLIGNLKHMTHKNNTVTRSVNVCDPRYSVTIVVRAIALGLPQVNERRQSYPLTTPTPLNR